MPRYNTALASNFITGSTTIGSPFQGAFTALTGTAPYTVTLPAPGLFPGSNQTFYNNTSGTVTLSTPSGSFSGTGGSGSSTLLMYTGNVASITSDGTNYVVISEDGSALVATTGQFSGDVTMNGGFATVSITPSTLTVAPTSTSNINNVAIGSTTRASGAFTTLAANNQVQFTGNIASSSTTTGSLIVTGGIGASGTIYAAGFNGPLTGTLQTAAQPNITSHGTLTSLAVSGTSTLTGTVNIQDGANRFFDAGYDSGSVRLRLAASEGGWGMGYQFANNAGTVLGGIVAGGSSQTMSTLIFNGPGNSESIRIDSSNNVAIGVNANANAKLHVMSSTNTTASIIGGSIHIRDTTAAVGTSGMAGVAFSSSPGLDWAIGKYWSGSSSQFVIKDGAAALGSNFVTIGSTGIVGIGTSDFSYTTSDNTPLVGSNTSNRMFVNGSVQLLSNDDAFVVGRSSASFFKDEEIGFGWGGGWYMTEGTYLRVRNNKIIYSTNYNWHSGLIAQSSVGANSASGNTIGSYVLGNGRWWNTAGGAQYIHFVLPSRYNQNNSLMWCLEIKGYDFARPGIINIMIGGYVTPPSNGGPMSRVAAWDAQSYYSPTAYYSSTYGAGVARIYMPDRYYASFTVNSIASGNGDVIAPNELRIIESSSSTI